jgi:predicted small metal-binding protein
METIIQCKDIGYKCDFKAIGKNLSEAIKIISEHGKKIHKIKPEWNY